MQNSTRLLWPAFLLCLGVACSTVLVAPVSAAEPGAITYRYRHHLFTVRPGRYPEWRGLREEWLLYGQPTQPRPEWRAEGDVPQPLPPGVERVLVPDWNRNAIAATLAQVVGKPLARAPGKVIISRTASGAYAFSGVGLTGRSVDIDRTVALTIQAMDAGVPVVLLPVEEAQPDITVTDPDLIARGIKEVVTVGESDFSDSPVNRVHNIGVGLARFNGHLIPKGETFSFIKVLGPVNAAAGYRKELVILGDKTLPDFGGGLCQVSSTAYRGIWEYGLPIVQRRNHSFAVNHYSPQGTDATIYPPSTDLKFTNDTPGDLLMQTYADDNDRAYFIYYGTHDDRTSEIVGPFTWGQTPPPPEKTEYTTEIPPGTKRKVGSAVPGMKTVWYRLVKPEGGELTEEEYFSSYQARPLFYQVGMDPAAPAAEAVPDNVAPSWLGAEGD